MKPLSVDALSDVLTYSGGDPFVEMEPGIEAAAAERAARQLGARFTNLGDAASKGELLEALATGLGFPDYFGWNWDALEEVLATPKDWFDGPILIWWPQPDRLRLADPDADRTFRSILESSARAREERSAKPLIVALPSSPDAAAQTSEESFGLSLDVPGRVHHVAVVVRDMEQALGFYRDRLNLPVELVLPIESDGVTIAFLPVGESKIELVQPTDPSTGVARFLESRGEGFHHVCLEVADINAELDRLAADGIELIDTIARPGAEGPVAFIHPRSCNGVLVELIEAPGGPAWSDLGLTAP